MSAPAPCRALHLSIDLEADTMPELRDQLIDLAGQLHELARLGDIPASRTITASAPGHSLLANLTHDPSMTPERFRAENAAHFQRIFEARQEARRG